MKAQDLLIPNKRDYFLTSAFELNGSINETSLLDRTSEDLLHQISMDTLFDITFYKI